MFGLGLAVGIVGGGAAMFYIQPTIKVWVAKAFGYEPELVAAYEDLIVKLRASKAK
jgi:hypothetical protein